MDITKLLSDGIAAFGMEKCEHIDRFQTYLDMLLEKNEVMNLTAITDPEDAARKHFLDSLALFKAVDLHNKSIIDVGCGAGFPGLPLRLYDETIKLTLLDSLGKRVDFLKEAVNTILPNGSIECVHARAEEYAVQHRESYDIAVSRAVASLNMLAELCIPYVKIGGYFCAMKLVESDEEINGAKHAIAMLGGQIERIYDYNIPNTEIAHRIILIKKVKTTKNTYPRRFAKIKQQPL